MRRIYKELKKSLLYSFGLFSAVFALVHLLSVTLWRCCFHVFHTALWLKLWSKTPHALYKYRMGAIKGEGVLYFRMSALVPHTQSARLHFASIHGLEFAEH